MLDTHDATCRFCGASLRLLDEDTVVGMSADVGDRGPRPGDWASLVTGISCPGADDVGDGPRHAPDPVDSDGPLAHRLRVAVMPLAGMLGAERGVADATAFFPQDTQEGAARRCLELHGVDDLTWLAEFGPTRERSRIIPPSHDQAGVPLTELDEGSLPWFYLQLGDRSTLEGVDPARGGIPTATILNAYINEYHGTWCDYVLATAREIYDKAHAEKGRPVNG